MKNRGVGVIKYPNGKNLSETRGSLRGIGEVIFEGKRYFVKSRGDGSQPGPQPYPPIERDTFRVKLDPDGYWTRENPNAQMTCIDEKNNVWDVKLLLPHSVSIFYYYRGTEIEILECGDFENVKSFTFHEGITYNVAGYSVKFTAEPNWAKLESAENLFGGLQNKSFDINFEYNPDVLNYSCRGMFMNCTQMEYAPEIVTLASPDLSNMFFNCIALKEIPEWLGDRMEEMGPYMPYGINLSAMFWYCTSLKTIPLNFIEALNYASSVNSTFMDCNNMESNILAAYNKLVQYNVEHNENTFSYCGINTETGYAELEQIPESWGGLKSESAELTPIYLTPGNRYTNWSTFMEDDWYRTDPDDYIRYTPWAADARDAGMTKVFMCMPQYGGAMYWEFDEPQTSVTFIVQASWLNDDFHIQYQEGWNGQIHTSELIQNVDYRDDTKSTTVTLQFSEPVTRCKIHPSLKLTDDSQSTMWWTLGMKAMD